VDLAKDRAIEAILNGMAQRRRRAPKAAGNTPATLSPRSQPVAPFPARRNPHRCNCGTCKICEDNARWERVFNEKFADPDYYAARPIRQGSSLSPLK
jgi:hypothetical protein